MHRTLITLAVAFSLVSCAVGPDFKKPAAPTATQFTRSGDWDIATTVSDSNSSAIKPNWWEDFGSPAINQAVELALKNNPNINASLANLEVAQRNVAAQQGYFFPSLQLGISGSKQNTGNYIAPATSAAQNPYNLMTKQISIGYVPDVFGGNRRQVESLKAQAQAQKYQTEALRLTIASNVVAALIQEASLKKQLALAERYVSTARQALQHLQEMFDIGYASQIDLGNQEIALSQSIQAVAQVKKSLDQTRDLIAVLCGKFPSEIVNSLDLIELKVPAIPNALPSRLVEQRPDVLAAEELARAANAQIGSALANMLPQFLISASSGGAAGVLNQTLASGNRFWNLNESISQPLFDGGTLYARKKAAEAGTDVAMAQYQSTVLIAFQNVADTLYAYANDMATYQQSERIEISSRKIFNATEAQFATGYASSLGLLTAEQGYLQADAVRYQNMAIYLGDVVSLFQALGGGWQSDQSTNK